MSSSASRHTRTITSCFQKEIEKTTPDPHGHSAALGPLFENRGRRSFETGYLTEIFTDRGIQFLESASQRAVLSPHGVQLRAYAGA